MTSSILSEHYLVFDKIPLISQYFPHLEHSQPKIWYISSIPNDEQLLKKLNTNELMSSYDVTMTSYCLYNSIVINLADVSRFSNLVFNLKVLTKSKNVLFVNFHQLNGKLWLVLYFLL